MSESTVWKTGPPPVMDDGSFAVVRFAPGVRWAVFPVLVRLWQDRIIISEEGDRMGRTYRYDEVEAHILIPPFGG